jgi:hypothetical protein
MCKKGVPVSEIHRVVQVGRDDIQAEEHWCHISMRDELDIPLFIRSHLGDLY